MKESNTESVRLFEALVLEPRERQVIAAIAELRSVLSTRVRDPKRWTQSLRRVQFARGVQASSSIEGYDAVLDDAMAIDLGEAPLDADVETSLAIKGYRDAMTYVLQLAAEPQFHFEEQLLKSLHFMMTSYDLKKRPGRWRSGSIYIYDDQTRELVYEGPDVELVPNLMGALVEELERNDDTPLLVKAALAHLNLVMIHPFADGNGRMARCLQTLVLAREGILSPVFSSIEEDLGRNIPSYYEVLAKVGKGAWNPRGDTRAWVQYALTAHYRQAKTLLRRTREIERLYMELDALVVRHQLPERVTDALFDAASGRRVRNSVYRAVLQGQSESEIQEQTATRDLKNLVALSLLQDHGERRGRYYTAGPVLQDIAASIREDRPSREQADPFDPDFTIDVEQEQLF